MVTVNNPTGTVMAIPERAGIVIVRDARLFTRAATVRRGISDRHCVITDDTFFLPSRARARSAGAGCLSATHFSPAVNAGLLPARRSGMRARREYTVCFPDVNKRVRYARIRAVRPFDSRAPASSISASRRRRIRAQGS